MRRTPDSTRRRLLAGGVAVVTALVLAACGSDGSDSSGRRGQRHPEAPARGPDTDDLGQTVELDKTPVRIAAYGDAAAALWRFGVTPVAIFTWMDPADDVMFDGLDLSETEVVGSAYGEISLEKLAAAKPDIIVATSYTGDTADEMYGFKDKTQLAKIKAIAPVIAVAQVGSMKDVIETNEELAKSLGVDTGDGSQVAQGPRRLRGRVRRADDGRRERALGGADVRRRRTASTSPKAPDDPALKYYQDIGVSFTKIGGKDYYWEILQLGERRPLRGRHPAQRDAQLLLDEAARRAADLRAARRPTRPARSTPGLSSSMDYPSQTKYMKELAGWLSSDKDVVSSPATQTRGFGATLMSRKVGTRLRVAGW